MTATRASRTRRRQPRGSVADRHGDTAGLVQQSESQARERSQAPANDPVVVLTFSFAGGQRLNSRLQRVPELACTTGTGILGMCDMVARAWENVEDSDGERMSSLAAKSIRAMVTTMMTVIVARSGDAAGVRPRPRNPPRPRDSCASPPTLSSSACTEPARTSCGPYSGAARGGS